MRRHTCSYRYHGSDSDISMQPGEKYSVISTLPSHTATPDRVLSDSLRVTGHAFHLPVGNFNLQKKSFVISVVFTLSLKQCVCIFFHFVY